MDNPQNLATLGTQDTGQSQTKQKHTTICKQTQINTFPFILIRFYFISYKMGRYELFNFLTLHKHVTERN